MPTVLLSLLADVPRRTARLLRSVGLAIVAFAAAVAILQPAHATKWGRDYFPNLTVQDQDGRQLNFYDDVLHGKIVVISFIYTTCRDICPLVTARLAQVQEKLGDAVGRDVFFVSISVDPERDTPERLKAHADAFGAGAGWKFITGDVEIIRQVRHKLGERSKSLGEHRNEILIGNDATGEWMHESAFGDLNILALTITKMDPARRRQMATARTGIDTARVVPESTIAPGQALFVRACAACHTIGNGRRVGPDLKDIAIRRERDWLNRYITAPATLRASGDATALALANEFRSVRMPTLGLSENDVGDVLKYIALESAKSDVGGTVSVKRAKATERLTPAPHH